MPERKRMAASIRSRSAMHIIDRSGSAAGAAAIYTLCDPRDADLVRYVGQTASPRRRFLQHVAEARLWQPAEVPWWIKREALRPLYGWIRALYQDECRLPLMSVVAWTDARGARQAEREHICEHLCRRLPLLNCEAEHFRYQLRLL